VESCRPGGFIYSVLRGKSKEINNIALCNIEGDCNCGVSQDDRPGAQGNRREEKHCNNVI